MQQQEREENRKPQGIESSATTTRQVRASAGFVQVPGSTWYGSTVECQDGTDEDQLVVHSREWTGEREVDKAERNCTCTNCDDYGLLLFDVCSRAKTRCCASGYNIRRSRKTRGR